MKRIVKIKLRDVGKFWDYDASNIELKWRDRVLLETERGLGMGTVVVEPREVEDSQVPQNIKKIIRKANKDDLEKERKNLLKEVEAYKFCLQRIKEWELKMKLVRVEFYYDGSKAIFYFTAEKRVDFRELVKDLANKFHTRIELRQIGVRDEARMMGGLGSCGKELCCSTFLSAFEPVSVRMAKEQSLSLNPAKVSGVCGRLMCCLSFEHAAYLELQKELPPCGVRVATPSGEGKIIEQDIIAQKVRVRLEDGQELSFSPAEIKPVDFFAKPADKEKE